MDREGSIKLLAAILTDLPQLTGASCIGRHELFDPPPGLPGNGYRNPHQERERVHQAATLCTGCPVKARCPSVTVAAITTVEVIPAPRRPAPPPGVLTN